jgi:hypothetical protein
MSPVDAISLWHSRLLRGEHRAVRVLPEPAVPLAANRPIALFPGAFNPLHAGHRQMADVAADMLGQLVEFEISIENVDKPPLTPAEIADRLEQFPPHQPVWLTRAARFAEKAEQFPQATFIVGVDTLVRITDARYYADDTAAAARATDRIAASGCRFLVFGRVSATGFLTLSDVTLPGTLAAICREVPESRFRADVSSTQVRIARNS